MDIGSVIQLVESFSVATIVLWVVSKIVDAVLSRTINERVISELVSSGIRRFKIFRTRYKPIGASFEYSINISDNVSVEESKEKIRDCVYQCEERSRGSLEVIRFDWTDGTTATGEISYINDNNMSVEIQLMPNHNSLRSDDVDGIVDAELSSIGIDINFQFEFHNLRGEILNLSNFSDFLSKSIASEFETRSVSNSTITVSSLDDSLTLDDWIKEKQFDVSLLLQSEDEERSVEFTGDRAVISSPYTGVDDTTADYIEATLLNYYL